MSDFGARKGEKRFLTGTGFGFICALLALLLLFVLPKNDQFISNLRQKSFDLLMPIITSFSWPLERMRDAGENMTELVDLRQKNASLAAENAALRQDIISLTRDSALLSQYRSLLSMPIESDSKIIGARVVADLRSPFVKTLVVNRGKDDGVVIGHAVMGARGLIGRVISVGDKSSRVLLATDFNSNIPVVTLTSNVRAILAGQNNPQPMLKFLPRKAELQNNAALVTSGDGGQMPIGLPVGEIVLSEDGRPFVNLYDDLEQLVHVRLVLSQGVPDVPDGLVKSRGR